MTMTTKTETKERPYPTVTIDLDQAVRLVLPQLAPNLKPSRFVVPDGRSGWMLRLPGESPIATPAYEDGLLFVGGGYGSYDFYAFDAASGELAWKMTTADDGPTAAVVERGCVAFNTESCSVIVCEARTGRILWQEWLGDPLMSQPAIAGERLLIAYPVGHHKPLLGPEMTMEQMRAAIEAAMQRAPGGTPQHRLLCTDLRTGRHLWEQEITGDVITAPVVDGEQVFLTCLDGMSSTSRTAAWFGKNRRRGPAPRSFPAAA
jgi:outer membrane protein assembly factor BamB